MDFEQNIHTRGYLLIKNAENEDSVMFKYVKSYSKQVL